MDKFYITCGSFEFVSTARDARSAALWSIHQFLSKRIELGSVEWTDPETIDRDDIIEAMLELHEEILVSEVGFQRDDIGRLDTADILTEWNQLVIAIQRLEALIA